MYVMSQIVSPFYTRNKCDIQTFAYDFFLTENDEEKTYLLLA